MHGRPSNHHRVVCMIAHKRTNDQDIVAMWGKYAPVHRDGGGNTSAIGVSGLASRAHTFNLESKAEDDNARVSETRILERED